MTSVRAPRLRVVPFGAVPRALVLLVCGFAAPAGAQEPLCAAVRPTGVGAGDLYGCALEVAGDRLVVGSLGDDDRGADAGAGYLFERAGTGWRERAKLLSASPGAGDTLGWSAALAGDCAVLGAPSASVAGASRAGAAEVFCAPTWTSLVRWTAPSPSALDQLGWSVAVTTARAAVSAPGDDERGSAAGAVYVFERVQGIWQTAACKLTAPDGETGDAFGWAVDLAGDRLAVGAPFADAGGVNTGAVYVFRRRGECDWTLEAKLANGRTRSALGRGVALSGARLLAGAPGERLGAGAAYLSTLGEAGWTPLADLGLPSAAGDQLGAAVAASPQALAAAAHFDDDRAEDAGAVYLFRGDGAATKLFDAAGAVGDGFGLGVTTDGQTLVIGSFLNDGAGEDAGAAFACALLSPPPPPPPPPPSPGRADLAVSIGDDREVTLTGEPLLLSIEARNIGPDAASGARLSADFPNRLEDVTWTCTASGGAACPRAAGSGDLDEAISLPAGGALLYAAIGVVRCGAEGVLRNAAEILAAPGTDPNPANNSALDKTRLIQGQCPF